MFSIGWSEGFVHDTGSSACAMMEELPEVLAPVVVLVQVHSVSMMVAVFAVKFVQLST